MSHLNTIYSGKKVFITGHTGFKGSWLVQWLHAMGAEVSGFSLDPITTPNLFDAADLASICSDHRGDLREAQPILEMMKREQPDAVFHLAAQPLVRESYERSVETFDINVMGSVHVFEAVRAVASVKALVHVGTDKVYENEEWDYGYRENDPLGGHDPYSASKAAAEIAFQSYLRSFFIPSGRILAASGRAGNVIGGGDWAKDRIVPDSVKALSEGRPIGVRNPNSTRPWQHVLEALSGYLHLGARLLQGDTKAVGSWNFGPKAESIHTVGDLSDGLVAAWGSGSWEHTGDPNAPHEAGMLTLCIDKARQQLGWEPSWEFDTTLQRTADWYRGFREGKSARDLCRRDIDTYMGAA